MKTALSLKNRYFVACGVALIQGIALHYQIRDARSLPAFFLLTLVFLPQTLYCVECWSFRTFTAVLGLCAMTLAADLSMAAKFGTIRAAHRLSDHSLLAVLLCLWVFALPFVLRWTEKTSKDPSWKALILSWVHTVLALVLSISAALLFAALLYEWLVWGGSAPFEAFFLTSVCLFYAVVFVSIRTGLLRAGLWLKIFRNNLKRE